MLKLRRKQGYVHSLYACQNWQAHNQVYMYLTIRPVALAGYGPIAHEAKPNGLLTRGP